MSLRGNLYTTQAGTVYLKQAFTWDRFLWGGRVMRIDESTQNLGDNTLTFEQDARGGIEVDDMLQGTPGTVDFSLVMKFQQGKRNKTELLKCFWLVDARQHCQGRDRDAPDAWEEITRKVFARANTRTMPATTFEGEEQAMISIPFNGMFEYDIYRISPEKLIFGTIP